MSVTKSRGSAAETQKAPQEELIEPVNAKGAQDAENANSLDRNTDADARDNAADVLGLPNSDERQNSRKGSFVERRKRQSKFDASLLPESEDPAEILKQVEFYLSDSNLPHDKFLWMETQKNNGWVSIRKISSFKRMHRFKSFELIVQALRSSPQLLEVDEEGQNVRRKIPLGKQFDGGPPVERTIYAKGFGQETPRSQIEIENFFCKFGPTNQVRLRRKDDGEFKGSVFVEFSNPEIANQVLQSGNLKWGENDLVVMPKKAYLDMKSKEHHGEDRAPRPFNAFREMKRQGSRIQDRSYGKGDKLHRGRKRSAKEQFGAANGGREAKRLATQVDEEETVQQSGATKGRPQSETQKAFTRANKERTPEKPKK